MLVPLSNGLSLVQEVLYSATPLNCTPLGTNQISHNEGVIYIGNSLFGTQALISKEKITILRGFWSKGCFVLYRNG